MPNVRGVDINPPRGEPRRYKKPEAPEVILSGKYPDGQDRHGINPDNVHTTAKAQRYEDGKQHRAALRGEE